MSALKKMTQELAQASSVKEALSLGFVKETFVKNYQAITGRKDGENRFMSEIFHYLEIVNNDDKLKKADRFSHFASIIKAGTTGLSFSKEGQLYPIVYGTTVKVQIGAHGKRELLRRMPTVRFVGEGQVVLKGDTFKHDKLNNILVEHITSEKQPPATLDNIVAAYFRLIFSDNKVVDVVVYHDELVKAKSKSKDTRDNNTWNEWPVQMAVKVAYNRGYKLYYSAPQVEVSGELKGFDVEEDEEEEEVTKETTHQEVPSYDAGDTIDPRATVEPVVQQQVTIDKGPKAFKAAKAEDKDIEDYLKR